jgi:hypothetical protein
MLKKLFVAVFVLAAVSSAFGTNIYGGATPPYGTVAQSYVQQQTYQRPLNYRDLVNPG